MQVGEVWIYEIPLRLISHQRSLLQLSLKADVVNIKAWIRCGSAPHGITQSVLPVSHNHNLISNNIYLALYLLFTYSYFSSWAYWFLTPDVTDFSQRHCCSPVSNWIRALYNMSAYTASEKTYFCLYCTLWCSSKRLWGVNIQPSRPGNCHWPPQWEHKRRYSCICLSHLLPLCTQTE